jgi:hypothetical protein
MRRIPSTAITAAYFAAVVLAIFVACGGSLLAVAG